MILPDILAPDLDVIFCGVAAGTRSAEVGMYYAHPGNRFWQVLFETGLTPRRLSPAEMEALPGFGIGLTDIAKDAAGPDSAIPKTAFAPARLAALLEACRPAFIAFNGKNAAQAALGRRVDYGEQASLSLCGAIPWALPSTSGMARRYWSVEPWRALAETVRIRCASRLL